MPGTLLLGDAQTRQSGHQALFAMYITLPWTILMRNKFIWVKTNIFWLVDCHNWIETDCVIVGRDTQKKNKNKYPTKRQKISYVLRTTFKITAWTNLSTFAFYTLWFRAIIFFFFFFFCLSQMNAREFIFAFFLEQNRQPTLARHRMLSRAYKCNSKLNPNASSLA